MPNFQWNETAVILWAGTFITFTPPTTIGRIVGGGGGGEGGGGGGNQGHVPSLPDDIKYS